MRCSIHPGPQVIDAPTKYEAVLISSSNEPSAPVPLVVTADGTATCTRALKGDSSLELKVHVRQAGSETTLWSSPPLESLQVGMLSRFGKLGVTALTREGDAPAGDAPARPAGPERPASAAPRGRRVARRMLAAIVAIVAVAG